VPFFPTLETLNLYYSYSPYHPHFYFTLHYSTSQYFKLILGNYCSLSFLFLLPAILGQVPKPLTAPVMNIEWDYNYYQPWSDNEWLVDKMLAMLNKDIIMQ